MHRMFGKVQVKVDETTDVDHGAVDPSNEQTKSQGTADPLGVSCHALWQWLAIAVDSSMLELSAVIVSMMSLHHVDSIVG